MNAQQLYDDFESTAPLIYSYTNGVFDQEFLNPDTSGINSSLYCAKYTRNASEQWDVILVEPHSVMQNLGPYLDGTKTITMQIKTEVAATIQITLESKTKALPTNYPTGRHSVYLASTSGSNEWETITFEFDQQPDAQISNFEVDRLVILVNPGSFTNDIYYLDNIYGPEFDNPCQEEATDSSIADDFDCQRNVSFDFTNGNMSLVSDPLSDEDTSSNTCAKFVKWTTVTDGAFGGLFDFPFTTSLYNSLAIDLYDVEESQDFMIILQDSLGNNLSEQTITTAGPSGTSNWVTHTLSIANIDPATRIEKFVLLLSPGSVEEDSIYLDNFRLFLDTGSNNTSSSTQELGEFGGKGELKIYPSPLNDHEFLHVELDFDYKSLTLDVYTLEGKRIYQFNPLVPAQKHSFELGQLSKGVYVLSLTVDGQKQFVQRLIQN